MNNTDKIILDEIKKALFKYIFKDSCKNYDDLVWHHQYGKDKDISKCGNLKEALDEIKKHICLPLPKEFHDMIHVLYPGAFFVFAYYPISELNKIARSKIFDTYNQLNGDLQLNINYGDKKEGCAYEFAKRGNAKINYCNQIKSKYIPSKTTWEDLFDVLGI